MCGLSGVGKTTIARELAPLVNGVVLCTDKIRKELFLKPKYGRQERKLVYDILILLAKYLSNANINYILDATFATEESRQELRYKMGNDTKEIRIVECVCPEDIVIARLKKRRHDYSDANFSVYKKMKRVYERVKEKHITVDTSRISRIGIRTIAADILRGK